MSMSRQWRLAARPVGKIRKSDFELVEVPVPEPADGQFVVAVTHISLDPAMRGSDERRPFVYPARRDRRGHAGSYAWPRHRFAQ